MTDNEAMRYAWAQLRGKLEGDKWTVGENFMRETWFIYGWAARTAWDEHKRAELQAETAGEGEGGK